MKTIIILLLVSAVIMHAQDTEPTQLHFNFLGNSNYYLSADSVYFKQTDFILGWAWSGGRKMSEALMDNQAHIRTDLPVTKDSLKSNTKLVLNAINIYDNGGGLTGVNSQSLWYSPVLQITSPGSFSNIRMGDPRNSIFGFRNIRGESIGNNDVGLKLKTSGNYVDSVVLENAWANSYLYWYDPNSRIVDEDEKKINTEIMYFVINLRRGDSTNNIQDNEPVLEIGLPYQINGVSNYIQFDSVPATSIYADTFHIRTSLNEFRGVASTVNEADPWTRGFYITRRMLPRDTGNITIYARFSCNNLINHNPKLTSGANLGINAIYHGNTDIVINHMYLATQNARKLYFGKKDKIIRGNVQADLDHYTQSQFSSAGMTVKIEFFEPTSII